ADRKAVDPGGAGLEPDRNAIGCRGVRQRSAGKGAAACRTLADACGVGVEHAVGLRPSRVGERNRQSNECGSEVSASVAAESGSAQQNSPIFKLKRQRFFSRSCGNLSKSRAPGAIVEIWVDC